MISKNSVRGPEPTNTATRMAGSRVFSRRSSRSSDWLETCTPGDAVASRAPLGRADLPTASYTEMMEWALPTVARSRYHALVEEFSTRPDAMPFLRGGIWRGFFTKYAESNLLHKKMLHVSGKVRKLAEIKRRPGTILDRAERSDDAAACRGSATMLTGTAFSADFIRRICARRCGAP